MRLKRFLMLTVLSGLVSLASLAQTSTLSGTVVDESGTPLRFAPVRIQGTSLFSTTDSLGAFTINDVPYGTVTVTAGDERTAIASDNIEINAPQSTIKLTTRPSVSELLTAGATDIPTISINDEDMKEGSGQTISSVLTASRDAFVSATSFVFSAARFRIRGYEDDNFLTMMNGSYMTDLYNGRTPYSTWGGLNDVMRSREYSYGLNPAGYSYGGLGAVYHIDTRASRQRKQFQVTYSASNRSYNNRVMLTYGSGKNAKGWSYALSYSRRWAEEGYVDGTFYDGHSFFGSVEKEINSRHSVALTGFGAKTLNGRTGPAVRELFDLAGTNYYNPLWGYQDGKKRNSRVGDNFQPAVILTHDWKINNKSSLLTAVSFQSGSEKVSGIDWYNATDPRPDYYRYLPSFDPAYGDDPQTFEQNSTALENYLRNNPDALQIDWDALYEANQIHDTAKYIVSNRVIDIRRFGFNSVYNNTLTDRITVQAGLNWQQQESDYYKEVDDLLGGNYFLNLNQFADLTNPEDSASLQNDLDNPNRKLGEGDKYGYDYTAHIRKMSAWAQLVLKYDRFDYFIAAQMTSTEFYRTGNVRNGVFANSSLGDSEKQSFTDPSFKGGITYKLDGRNYFFVNAAFASRAPLFQNSFISPRTRNAVIPGLENESIVSTEGGYIIRAPKFRGRITGFYSAFQGGSEIQSFYEENFKTFVNYIVTKIDKQHTGVEIAADLNAGKGFTVTAVASIGQYIFSDRSQATITQDNRDTLLLENETVYVKNLKLAGGPQQAYTLGLNYRSPRFWFVSANVNYFSNTFVDINPARRTISALDLVDAGSDKWVEILSQEEFDPQMTVDVSAGWSWKLNNKFPSLKRNTFLVFNLGVTNILNNQDIPAYAFEYARFDTREKDVSRFPNKYAYTYGTTFFANVVLRFN